MLFVGTIATFLTAGCLYAFFVLRTWSEARRAPRHAPELVGLLVFGKRLVAGRPDAAFRWRLRHALRLLRAMPDLVVVLSGGHGDAADQGSEAEAAQRWLLRRMPEAVPRLRLEPRSRNTLDNLREARALLPPGPIGLVSNRYHLPRCLLLARELRLDVRACAAEPVLRLDRRMWRTLLLEGGYRTLFSVGRGWARLIRHRRMLARIG